MGSEMCIRDRRSLAEYEAWTGVDHYWHLVHPATATVQPPPSSASLNWAVELGLLAGAELQIGLPPLASVDARPCIEVHLAVLDATSRDAAARRVTPAEYAELEKTKWHVQLRFRSAPLRLVVWPRLDEGWGKRLEAHIATSMVANVCLPSPEPPKTPPPRASVRRARPPRKRVA